MLKIVYWSSCRVPVILVRFLMKTWILWTVFSKNIHIPNFMKILPVGAELLYAERRRVMTKLTVACSNSANTHTHTQRNNKTTSRTTTLEEMVLSLLLVVKSNVFFKTCQHHKSGGDLCHSSCKSWETWRHIRSIVMYIFGSFHKCYRHYVCCQWCSGWCWHTCSNLFKWPLRFSAFLCCLFR